MERVAEIVRSEWRAAAALEGVGEIDLSGDACPACGCTAPLADGGACSDCGLQLE